MQIRLPQEQATWTTQQVEDWLATQKLADLVSLAKAEEFAKEAGWQRPGTPPNAVKIPAAMIPAMGVLTDPHSWRTDMGSVYLDQQGATAYATDGKVAMRVRVKRTDATKGVEPERVGSVIPVRGDRKLLSFGTWALMRLCLSAIAAGDPEKPNDCRLDFYIGCEGSQPVRFEVVNREENTVQAVGAIMPMSVDKKPDDPAKIA